MAKKRAKSTLAEMARFSLTNVPQLLAEQGDLWDGQLTKRQRLERALVRAQQTWEK